MLEYHLVDNPLSPATDDTMAQVVGVRSYSEEEIAALMVMRGLRLTKGDIMAALEIYRSVIIDLVAEGAAVNTPLFHISHSIAGVFNGMADLYDPMRHSVKVNINASIALKAVAKGIKPRKVQVADPVPSIVEVKDMLSGSVNDRLTAGGVVQLLGTRLKFIESEITNGVFLLPEQGGAEHHLLHVVENKPSRVLTMLPADLPQGQYMLEVRTTFMQGRTDDQLSHIRIGRFNKTLTLL
jgi:hypothetical protein